MRYGNGGSKKGERCKPVRPQRMDAMTVRRVGVNTGRGAWSRYVEVACVNHISVWGGASYGSLQEILSVLFPLEVGQKEGIRPRNHFGYAPDRSSLHPRHQLFSITDIS